MSIPSSHCALRAGPRTNRGRRCNTSISTRCGRNSPAAFTGAWVRSRCGTTARPGTSRLTTTTANGVSCTVSRSRALRLRRDRYWLLPSPCKLFWRAADELGNHKRSVVGAIDIRNVHMMPDHGTGVWDEYPLETYRVEHCQGGWEPASYNLRTADGRE